MIIPENPNTLRDKIEKSFIQGRFDDVTTSLTDEVLATQKDAELYVWRGNIWYNKKKYDKAIADYNKALEINPKYEIALYNRGLGLVAKKEYDKAIVNFTDVIKLHSECAYVFYNDRGMAWKAKKEYDKAIADYTKAIKINPDFANAYYNRGLAKKEKNVDLKEIKHDFEKYLELTIDENDIWAKYAKYYLEDLDEKINDPELWSISQLVNAIRSTLLIEEECITHYSGLSVLKSLILDNCKFKISEGNFMNDTSEGKELFDFLKYKPNRLRKDGTYAETFTPKTFIGSFVTKDMHNDLNLWRFYGKEDGVPAKGCAITMHMQDFLEDIKDLLSNEVKEARQDDESDINFYRVAYLSHGTTNFYIPNSNKSGELTILMAKLKEKIRFYKVKNKTSL